MALVVVTAATETFVTLEEAKRHLRVEHGDDDVLITGLIGTADTLIGAEIHSALVATTYDWKLDGWPCDFRVPIGPAEAVSIGSVNYTSTGAAEAVLSASLYVVDTTRGVPRIRLKRGNVWPELDPDAAAPVRVRLTAGWANAAAVPFALKAAGLLTIGHLYENRQAVVIGGQPAQLPLAVPHLVAPYHWS